MQIRVLNKIYTIKEPEGILRFLEEDTLTTLNLEVNPRYFDILMTCTNYDDLNQKDTIECYKLAHYLFMESKMKILARKIADALAAGSYEEMREIIKCF